MIRNATLDAMELNFTAGTGVLLNYSEYTKVGADSRLTVTDYTISTNPDFRRGTEEGYYLDRGAGNIGVFLYEFEFVISDVDAGDADSRDMGSIFTVNNWIGDQQDQPGGTYDYLSVAIRNSGALDNWYTIRLVGGQNGAIVTNEISAAKLISPNTRYATVWRDAGGNCNVTVYQDSERTISLYSLADNDGGQSDAFRYEYAWFAQDAIGDANDWFVGSVSNLFNGSHGGFTPEGYFTTVDYLSDPFANGSALVAMTITDIPANTDIQLQFSNDTVVWTDHQGIPGNSVDLLGGLESIDLRGLNHSNAIQYRYNLSTSDPLITPRVNQSRLITTIGNASIITEIQNVSGAWIEYDLTEFNASVGTVDAGLLSSTFFIDGVMFNVSEVVGVPGMMLSGNFTDVDDDAISLWVLIYAHYDGNLNHDFDIEVWDFANSVWVEDDHITDVLELTFFNSTIYRLRIPANFLSNGEVRIRLDHESAGNINHDLMIDQIQLQAFIPSAAAEEPFQFFWIVIGIALMIIGIVLSRMWPEEGDP